MDVLILVPARDDPRPEDSCRPQFERLAAPLRARSSSSPLLIPIRHASSASSPAPK